MLETRRLENILERKRKIAEAEKLRFDDIMHRKRLLEENDIDRLRLERFVNKCDVSRTRGGPGDILVWIFGQSVDSRDGETKLHV